MNNVDELVDDGVPNESSAVTVVTSVDEAPPGKLTSVDDVDIRTLEPAPTVVHNAGAVVIAVAVTAASVAVSVEVLAGIRLMGGASEAEFEPEPEPELELAVVVVAVAKETRGTVRV